MHLAEAASHVEIDIPTAIEFDRLADFARDKFRVAIDKSRRLSLPLGRFLSRPVREA